MNFFTHWIQDLIGKCPVEKQLLADNASLRQEVETKTWLLNSCNDQADALTASSALNETTIFDLKEEITMYQTTVRLYEESEIEKDALIKGLQAANKNIYEEHLDQHYNRTTRLAYKRFVGKKMLPVFCDIRDFAKPSHTMRNNLWPVQIFTQHYTYVRDKYSVWGVPEIWQFDFETKELRKGDCEDLAFLKGNLYKMSSRIGPLEKKGLFYARVAWKSDTVNHLCIVRINPDFTGELLEATKQTNEWIDLPSDDYVVAQLFNENGVWTVNEVQE